MTLRVVTPEGCEIYSLCFARAARRARTSGPTPSSRGRTPAAVTPLPIGGGRNSSHPTGGGQVPGSTRASARWERSSRGRDVYDGGEAA